MKFFETDQSVLFEFSVKVRVSAGISAALKAHADIDTDSPEGSQLT